MKATTLIVGKKRNNPIVLVDDKDFVEVWRSLKAGHPNSAIVALNIVTKEFRINKRMGGVSENRDYTVSTFREAKTTPKRRAPRRYSPYAVLKTECGETWLPMKYSIADVAEAITRITGRGLKMVDLPNECYILKNDKRRVKTQLTFKVELTGKKKKSKSEKPSYNKERVLPEVSEPTNSALTEKWAIRMTWYGPESPQAIVKNPRRRADVKSALEYLAFRICGQRIEMEYVSVQNKQFTPVGADDRYDYELIPVVEV